uniref:Secreted protein n=1 Tax=Parascaris equorum TaxID=6256 RepID=A0A914R763_PAREQ
MLFPGMNPGLWCTNCIIILLFVHTSQQPRIIIIGITEKAFLQLGFNLADRDVARFVWPKIPTHV